MPLSFATGSLIDPPTMEITMDFDYQFFDAQTIPAQSWKNGGGKTQEIISYPASSDWSNFIWRVSIAQIEKSGPFSVFEGIDRIICLLKGDGVVLHHSNAFSHVLNQVVEPYAFKGEESINSELLGQTSDDLNLMTRRNIAKGSLEVLHTSTHLTLEANCFYFCMVQTGQWRFYLENQNSDTPFLSCQNRQGFWSQAVQQTNTLIAQTSANTPGLYDEKPALIVMKIQLLPVATHETF
jgi:environmental stress-induced protein Ves